MDNAENLRAFAGKFANGTQEQRGLIAAAEEIERLREATHPNKTFFMVWSDHSHETHVQHRALADAEKEAIRLAEANPDCGFYVMVPLGVAKVSISRDAIYKQFEIDRDLFIPF